MGREERRRTEREHRRQARHSAPTGPGQNDLTTPAQVTKLGFLTPDDADRERQDFLAGTVFAAGAGVALPDSGPGGAPDPIFTIYVREDSSTFGPAPQLREAFRLLDQHGGVQLSQMLSVGTGWSAIDDPETPLIKLKLEFHTPMTGSTAVVLLAQNYAPHWRHIAGGGMVGITSIERLNRAPATFAGVVNASIVLGIQASPVVRHLVTTHSW